MFPAVVLLLLTSSLLAEGANPHKGDQLNRKLDPTLVWSDLLVQNMPSTHKKTSFLYKLTNKTRART